MKRDNLPIIYRPDILNNQEGDMKIKQGTIPQYINIFLIVFGVLGAGGWYMGNLDNSVKSIEFKIDSIVELQKVSNKKFEMLASGIVNNQIKIVESSTKVSALEIKTSQIEKRQYQNRPSKSKKRRR